MSFDFLARLIPPGDPNDDRVTRWRWTTMIFVSVFSLVIIFHIAATKGWVWGLSSYALAADVNKQIADLNGSITANAESLNGIKIILLRGAISDARTAQCHAIATGNIPARRLAENNLRDYLDQYEEATGRSYPLLEGAPSCTSF